MAATTDAHGADHLDVVPRILNFEVDEKPDAELGFRDRLARENGWSAAFAHRVYDEYRRFLVLAATAEHAVTPSDEVDQAWHLHLVYTRSYWDHLCGEVLGRPLHHGPTVGGPAEGERYSSQYEATLASYRTTFGTEPPSDIWPPPSERFRAPERWARVDRSANLVLRRRPVVALAIALVALLTSVGAASSGSDTGAPWALIIGVALVGAVLTSVINRGSGGGRRGGDGGCGGGDSGCGTSGCGSSGCGGGGCGGGGCGS